MPDQILAVCAGPGLATFSVPCANYCCYRISFNVIFYCADGAARLRAVPQPRRSQPPVVLPQRPGQLGGPPQGRVMEGFEKGGLCSWLDSADAHSGCQHAGMMRPLIMSLVKKTLSVRLSLPNGAPCLLRSLWALLLRSPLPP